MPVESVSGESSPGSLPIAPKQHNTDKREGTQIHHRRLLTWTRRDHRTPTQYPDTRYDARTQKAQTYYTRRHTRSGSPHQGSKTHHTPIPWTHTALHARHRFPPHNARYTASTSQTQASTHASPAPASKLPQTHGHEETKTRAHTGSSAGRDFACAQRGWDPSSARPPCRGLECWSPHLADQLPAPVHAP